MEQNNKVLVLAALIVLVTLVSFQLGGVTGKAAKDVDVSVMVVEDSVTFTKMKTGNFEENRKAVTLTVDTPTKFKLDEDVDLILVKEGSDLKIQSDSLDCENNQCTGSITTTLWIGSDLAEQYGDGVLYFQVYPKNDRNRGDAFTSNTFKMVVN